MIIKRLLVTALLLPCAIAAARAQNTPVTIAIFPIKNLTGEVKYDSLSWAYTDSLATALNAGTGAGTRFKLVPVADVRDQMLAQNVDVKSPSYETDVWKLAKIMGAQKIIWGTYYMKYEKANIEIKIFDMKTLLPDQVNIANKLRVPYGEALTTVPRAAEKLLPGMK